MKAVADKNGYYGEFGGAYIPEMLYNNISELKSRYLDIINSKEFRDEYMQLLKDYVGRPSPLYYAGRLSHHFGTRIFLKREDLNHTGSHKINNTVGQIILASKLGKKRIIAETGAGQHGVATATVCALKGLECIVYMGATDVERQARNVTLMEMLGAKVVPVESGNKTLKDATNEALRDWISNPESTHYIIGSIVGPHPFPDMVTRFQSVISLEMKSQLKEKTGSEDPDYILACIGGGSNAAGAFYHYVENENVKLIGAEGGGMGAETDLTSASITTGRPGVLHACKSLLLQTTDGQVIEPYSISAGLDYPGVGPLHSYLHARGRARYYSINDDDALKAAKQMIELEGIIPALESAHALALLDKMDFNSNDVVVVNLSGRGDKDLETYIKRFDDE
ncbi:MAG: tryptophan synthase subunit beta [Bacteroidales bacterium]|nr:tryptophan synthase subunit beta [Bacteroidales bacterium]